MTGMASRRERTKRRFTGVRLDPEEYAKAEQLAKVETEGNVSQMLRKLLSEALRARETRKP